MDEPRACLVGGGRLGVGLAFASSGGDSVPSSGSEVSLGGRDAAAGGEVALCHPILENRLENILNDVRMCKRKNG